MNLLHCHTFSHRGFWGSILISITGTGDSGKAPNSGQLPNVINSPVRDLGPMLRKLPMPGNPRWRQRLALESSLAPRSPFLCASAPLREPNLLLRRLRRLPRRTTLTEHHSAPNRPQEYAREPLHHPGSSPGWSPSPTGEEEKPFSYTPQVRIGSTSIGESNNAQTRSVPCV